jgi:hypothetical protein
MQTFARSLITWTLAVLLVALVQAGGVQAVVTVKPSLSSGITYTDNRDLDPEDEEEEDYVVTVSPAIDIDVTGRLSNVSFTYNPTYASYVRFPEDNTLRHSANLSASRQMSRTTDLELSNQYLYTEDPLGDPDQPITDADTTLRRGRETYSINTTSINLVNEFGDEDQISFGYTYFFLENDGQFVEDRHYHKPNVTIIYWLEPNVYALQSDLSYTRRHFDQTEDYNDTYGQLRLIRRVSPHMEIFAEYAHEVTNFVDDGTDYQVYSPAAGFSWQETKSSNFSARVGYFFQDRDGGDDTSGPVADITTSYRLDPRSAVRLVGLIGYDQADTSAETLGFNTFYSVTGSLDHQLGRRTYSRLSAGYRRNIYTEEEPDREDRIWQVTAGLTYRPLPWMDIDVGYIFRDLESNRDLSDYTENRVQFKVSVSPRQPPLVFR